MDSVHPSSIRESNLPFPFLFSVWDLEKVAKPVGVHTLNPTYFSFTVSPAPLTALIQFQGLPKQNRNTVDLKRLKKKKSCTQLDYVAPSTCTKDHRSWELRFLEQKRWICQSFSWLPPW